MEIFPAGLAVTLNRAMWSVLLSAPFADALDLGSTASQLEDCARLLMETRAGTRHEERHTDDRWDGTGGDGSAIAEVRFNHPKMETYCGFCEAPQ